MPSPRCEAPKGWTLYQCEHGSRVWLPKRCRRCAPCQEARRAKTIAKILNGLEGEKDVALLTLTSVPGTTWPQIMRAWQQLARWLRRTSPDLTYACIKESGTKTGMKHLHIILVGANFTPYHRLSAEWARLTRAWSVDIQRIHSRKAAAYVAKYVAKSDVPVRKVVTFGRAWPKLPPQQRTAQPIDSCGPWGPAKFTLLVGISGLVDMLTPECDCWGDARPPDLEVHLWLRSIPARLSQMPPGQSAR